MDNNIKNKALTVSEFCQQIKDFLPAKKFMVTGEVNQLKNSHGHHYFTFKDNDNIINATIWKSKMESLKLTIKDGDKITVEGKLDFYSTGGKLNFIIDKIVTNDGIGDLLKKYQKIKDDFEKKGYFDPTTKLKLPNCIKNILLLTSESGAAYHDFIYGLENAKSNVNVELIDVIVQGNDCPKNICEQLENIKSENLNYDLVIITRGGGSFQDLFGFSQPELIEAIHNFNLPTLSAIGHQIDNPLSDLVCDYSAPTPSLAAQFIVDYNKNYLKSYQKISKELTNVMNVKLINELEKVNNLLEKLNKKWLSFERNNKQTLINELNNMLRKLDTFESRLDMYETTNILLNGNGKIMQNKEDLLKYKGKTLEIIWNGVVAKVKIESIKTIE
jgi:exodeoxyribonuclease VII large subunit